MVLRLGNASDGPGTQFALVSTPGRLEDFFVVDETLNFHIPTTYLPELTLDNLFPYFVFPKLTEKSLVNLAFATGLMGYALGLEQPYPVAAPATGGSTYTFRYCLHKEFPVELTHRKGQVEIDAVFVGRRNNKDHLFILGTKCNSDQSLAKHKLIYPALALYPYVPKDMPIVPVYMRVAAGDKDIIYRIVECSFPDPRRGLVLVTTHVAIFPPSAIITEMMTFHTISAR